jgi:hypothetical protein
VHYILLAVGCELKLAIEYTVEGMVGSVISLVNSLYAVKSVVC